MSSGWRLVDILFRPLWAIEVARGGTCNGKRRRSPFVPSSSNLHWPVIIHGDRPPPLLRMGIFALGKTDAGTSIPECVAGKNAEDLYLLFGLAET